MDKRELDKILEHLEESKVIEILMDRLSKKIGGLINSGKQQLEPEIKYVDKKVFVDREVEKIVHREVTPSWAKGLEDCQQLVQSVRQFPALAVILLGDAPEPQQVVRLLVCGSQWTNILRVWDVIADRCKQTQQAASQTELLILHSCIALFNQTLQDCKVQLLAVSEGEAYDYNQHQRANFKGDRIQCILLAGLLFAAGDNVRSALALTN